METSISPPGTSKQSAVRKPSPGSSLKDLCLVSKQGSIAEVESALALLKKSGGNIDGRNAFGLSALHLATWRNHLPIVRRLLDAGADPDARDGESGWSSLHRALHFGHLCIAGVLLQFGASLALEDTKGRTPVDLISCPVSQANGDFPDAVATEVFSWGSGTNYQLGTGNAHIQKLPCKVEALHGSYIKTVAASKFHSVAVSSNGELYTWGFGRGGRLGHPDIHSGQTTAVITPRQVTVGLGRKRVNAVAAAKHHTVIATELGELFTWGSNREGQLGYPSVDTQPTPRRVGSLKQRIISVAAANKHSAAVADTGEVFTWGCNKEGQLGYGTSNSASNCIPRMVEYLKGKVLRGVSAAKYHTIVLGADGEVFTWGHRLVTPRRVVVARCLKKGGNTNLKFHRMERLQVISVAAGTTHNTALTADGALFYWVSSDPDLKCQQIFSMCGRNIVNISAGKYWTAVATSTGDVFMWDAKKRKDETPIFTRVHGVKRATFVCVGETHMLVLSSIYHPEYPPKPKQKRKNKQSTQTPSVKNEPGQQIPITELQVLQVNVSAEKEAYAADPIKPMEAAAFSNTKDTASPPEKKPSQPTPSKKKNRKGGLSLFLSGALDDTPKPSLPAPAVPATPKPEGPAWGGVKITKGPASLRDIQTEQSRTNEPASAKAKDRHENSPDSAGRATRLSSFIPDARSSPVAVVAPARAAAAPSSEGDRSTPPWSSSATSPNVSQPSLRDIQQMQQRHHGGVSHSPKTQTSGFCIPPHGGAPEAAGGGGVKDNVPNRWFRPETDAPSSIRSIQIEEQAMKDFRRFYSSVRIVKPQV
ncbi:ankyrin repeat family protein / regulator of chromosome condensation (RCC1) family protein [Zea mays]|uniref:Ankyrin repeat family protein / regulator of chromosome condensation (RCC1) family protein n=1 Tax=Zea mays TaxID=4577 RepID=A0A1D6HSZ2_MAIZE|nr:ankyrin repeat family protein / regulator of chromosome condensation (RCC1) family protein [Zea mays]